MTQQIDQQIDQQIEAVAKQFVSELRRLHTAMDWRPHKTSRLSLRVDFSLESATFDIQFSDYPLDIKGSNLGIVMDETYRRLNYEHKEEARIGSSLKQLAAPQSGIEPSPFDPSQF